MPDRNTGNVRFDTSLKTAGFQVSHLTCLQFPVEKPLCCSPVLICGEDDGEQYKSHNAAVFDNCRKLQQIDEYLSQKRLPTRSFAEDAPSDLLLPPKLERLRPTVMEASTELRDLLEAALEKIKANQVRVPVNIFSI